MKKHTPYYYSIQFIILLTFNNILKKNLVRYNTQVIQDKVMRDALNMSQLYNYQIY